MAFRMKNPDNPNTYYGNGISKPIRNLSHFNIGIIGDPGTGKTSLVTKWTSSNTETKQHENFLSFRVHSHAYSSNGQISWLCLMDLEPTLEHVHPLQAYHFFDLVLVCYSVDNRKSFENALQVWSKELNEHCGGLHRVLVALKTDLRTDVDVIQKMAAEGTTPVTHEEGVEVFMTYGFHHYHECSSLTDDGCNELLVSIDIMKDIELD